MYHWTSSSHFNSAVNSEERIIFAVRVSSYADFLQAVSQFQCCHNRGNGSTDVWRDEAVLNLHLSAWSQHKMAVVRKWLQGTEEPVDRDADTVDTAHRTWEHKSLILTVFPATVRFVRNIVCANTFGIHRAFLFFCPSFLCSSHNVQENSARYTFPSAYRESHFLNSYKIWYLRYAMGGNF
jgi:hypothetical protein